MTSVATEPTAATATRPSSKVLVDRAETLDRWSATAPTPLATAYRRRAGALRLLAWIPSDACYPAA